MKRTAGWNHHPRIPVKTIPTKKSRLWPTGFSTNSARTFPSISPPFPDWKMPDTPPLHRNPSAAPGIARDRGLHFVYPAASTMPTAELPLPGLRHSLVVRDWYAILETVWDRRPLSRMRSPCPRPASIEVPERADAHRPRRILIQNRVVERDISFPTGHGRLAGLLEAPPARGDWCSPHRCMRRPTPIPSRRRTPANMPASYSIS